MTDDDYFLWLVSLIYDPKYFKGRTYYRLFKQLHNIEFTYLLDRDGNRYDDGISLRYRYCSDTGIDCPMEFQKKPCSVLEMISALAIRCEEQIMADQDYGNRTALWLHEMLYNLGLISMSDDSIYDARYVSNRIQIFLDRQYSPDGDGGLFHIRTSVDLRDVEIWCQLCWYLDAFNYYM